MVYPYNGILCSLKKEVLTHATTGVNLEDTMLSEITETQKDIYYMILLLKRGSQNSQVWGRKQNACSQGPGEGRNGELVFNG